MAMRRLARVFAEFSCAALTLTIVWSSPIFQASRRDDGSGNGLRQTRNSTGERSAMRHKGSNRFIPPRQEADGAEHPATSSTAGRTPEMPPRGQEAATSEAGAPPPETWSAAEIEAAARECDTILAGTDASYDHVPAIKDGACGTPAPITLRGFKSEGQPFLSFSPEPVVTCQLAGSLQHWINQVVQPAAVSHLRSRIVSLTNLSDYSCRMRYNNPSQKVSEHAIANAVDIGEFVTADGGHISVLDGWHSADERGAFLHAVHEGACEIFGTTLGPEANSAHANHFHLDAKKRRHPLCDFTPKQLREREEAQRLAAHQAEKEKKNKPQ